MNYSKMRSFVFVPYEFLEWISDFENLITGCNKHQNSEIITYLLTYLLNYLLTELPPS
jgi:hypothetical protein